MMQTIYLAQIQQKCDHHNSTKQGDSETTVNWA